MSDLQASGLRFRQLPDSPDARLLVELSSQASDLVEADQSLALAERFGAGTDDEQNAVEGLVASATMAYCRTHFPSAVRRPLTDHVPIPAEFQETNKLIGDFRNRQIAHSQSELTSTYALIGVDADGSIRQGVIAQTTSQSLPAPVLRQFRALIEHLLDEVGTLQTEVETRVIADVRATRLETVLSWPSGPEFAAVPVAEFRARTHRGRYPTRQTIYWHVEPAQE